MKVEPSKRKRLLFYETRFTLPVCSEKVRKSKGIPGFLNLPVAYPADCHAREVNRSPGPLVCALDITMCRANVPLDDGPHHSHPDMGKFAAEIAGKLL